MPVPVILLAFANDRADGARYLRNLPAERRAVEGALDAAARAGVCEVVTKTNVTLDELLDTLDDPRWRDRVAVLHYGGHAGGDRLLLESADGHAAAAHAAGLASVLAEQRGLTLVFLNGCSTRAQVDRLLAAGVPAVIATERAIDDATATELAAGFYRALAAGRGIDAAFRSATGGVRARLGEGTRGAYRDIEDDSAPAPDDRWPWELHLAPGAEHVAGWSLGVAAGDPLFGLAPLAPTDPLPAEPFRRLAWFGAEHAELFFGRGKDVRALYDRVTDEGAPPITLLHGAAGAGKSSLLAAGLLPRLGAAGWVPWYDRRDTTLGLAATLRRALERAADGPLAADAWRALERELDGRPLAVVLDQVEEALTRPLRADAAMPAAAPAESAPAAPMDDAAARRRAKFGLAPLPAASATPVRADELGVFVADLVALFRDADRRPRGRLVLGFRKEWLAEIEARLVEARLPFSKLFLDRLDRDGVVEAITGPARAPRLRARYQFTVEPGLAEVVADDLLVDRDSPVAPTLQVLLSKMWDAAAPARDGTRAFDGALYRRLQTEGILLADFLDQQLASLGVWQPEVVETGLALDVLGAHATPLGTSRTLPADALRAEYAHLGGALDELLRACVDRWLLADAAGGGTRLYHDTLAPLVRVRLEESDRPGQRARRLLEARAKEWRDGRTGRLLDDADLATVEAGRDGMRAWTVDEVQLVAESRMAARAREAERAVAAARTEEDPMVAAMLLGALEGAPEPPGGVAVASRVLREWIPAALLSRPEGGGLNAAALRDDGAVVTASRNDVVVWPASGAGDRMVWTPGAREEERGIEPMQYDLTPDGRWAAVCSRDAVLVKSLDDAGPARRLEPPADRTSAPPARKFVIASLTADGRRVLVTGPGGATVFDTATGTAIATVTLTGDRPRWGKLSPDGLTFVTWSDSGPDGAQEPARVWRIDESSGACTPIGSFATNGVMEFSPSGRRLLYDPGPAGGGRVAVVLAIDAEGVREVASFTPPSEGFSATLTSAAFGRDETCVAIASYDRTAWLLPLGGAGAPVPLHGHTDFVMSVACGARLVATGSADGTARLWTLDGRPHAVLRGHVAAVLDVAFDSEGWRLVTASVDGTARVWDCRLRTEPAAYPEPAELAGQSASRGWAKGLVVDREGRLVAMDVMVNGVAVILVHHVDPDADMPVVLRIRKREDDQWNFIATYVFSERDVVMAVSDNALERHRADGTGAAWAVPGPGPESNVYVVLSPDGSRAVAVEEGIAPTVWPTDGSRPPVTLAGDVRVTHGGGLAVSPDGALVCGGGPDGVALWSVDGDLRAVLVRPFGVVQAVAFSPDGRRVAVSPSQRVAVGPSMERTVFVWDVDAPASRPVLLEGHTREATDIAFTRDGRHLVTASHDGSARVWDLATGETVRILRGIGNLGHQVECSPRDDLVIISSAPGVVRLWDTVRGGPPFVLAEDDEVETPAARFTPDGRAVLVVGRDGRLRRWSVSWDDLVRRLARLTDGLRATARRATPHAAP